MMRDADTTYGVSVPPQHTIQQTHVCCMRNDGGNAVLCQQGSTSTHTATPTVDEGDTATVNRASPPYSSTIRVSHGLTIAESNGKLRAAGTPILSASKPWSCMRDTSLTC